MTDTQPADQAAATGSGLIAAERERQKSVEGWTPEHDDQHREGQLAYAGAAYALLHGLRTTFPPDHWEKLQIEKQATQEWPWESQWWKPSDDPIRNLAKAGALIAAEIDRMLHIQNSVLNQ